MLTCACQPPNGLAVPSGEQGDGGGGRQATRRSTFAGGWHPGLHHNERRHHGFDTARARCVDGPSHSDRGVRLQTSPASLARPSARSFSR